ncbi:MAG: hypothetical protein AABM64_06660 [Pseudomonadota bacterium]
MHLIRDKKSKQVLFIDYAATADPQPGAAVYPAFDPATMEVGWTDQSYIPAFHDIDAAGRVVELDLDEAARRGLYQPDPTQKLVGGKLVAKSDKELVAEGLLDLAAMKAQAIEACSKAALELRAKLIPDYKLQNAALGVYDDDRLPAYRATIEAFRAEVHRLEAAIEKAKTLQDLRAITPKFPDSIISAPAGPPEDKPRRKK